MSRDCRKTRKVVDFDNQGWASSIYTIIYGKWQVAALFLQFVKDKIFFKTQFDTF